MTHQTHTGHRAVIQAAIEDWWITTDLPEPFNPHAVATQIDMYLAASGHTITPDPRKHPMPTRRTITGALLIARLTAASTLATAIRHQWGWTTAGALVTGFLTREAIRALGTRRRDRT